jgi:hypothetical protein
VIQNNSHRIPAYKETSKNDVRKNGKKTINPLYIAVESTKKNFLFEIIFTEMIFPMMTHRAEYKNKIEASEGSLWRSFIVCSIACCDITVEVAQRSEEQDKSPIKRTRIDFHSGSEDTKASKIVFFLFLRFLKKSRDTSE